MSRVRTYLRNALLVLALCGSPVLADYCINKDLMNLGPTAYDIAVVLEGSQPILSHYDGPYPMGIFFSTYNDYLVGTDTELHWQDPNVPINFGDVIHVGWCVPEYTPILDMYWTDEFGKRIPGSIVYQTGAHGRYNGRDFTVIFDNPFDPLQGRRQPLYIWNVEYAVIPFPVPLEELNGANPYLNENFRPLVEQLPPIRPDQRIFITLPQRPAPTDYVVLRYYVYSEESGAFSWDSVQMSVTNQ